MPDATDMTAEQIVAEIEMVLRYEEREHVNDLFRAHKREKREKRDAMRYYNLR